MSGIYRPQSLKFHRMQKKRHKTNLAQLLMRAFYWLDDSLQANLGHEFEGLAVTHSQSMIIITIGEGIQRPSAIAERIGVSRQAIHTSLNTLVAQGLVDLVPDPDDRRAKIAVLSATGEPIRRRARELFDEFEKELGKRIGKTNIATLREILELDWKEPYSVSTPPSKG